MYSLHLSRLLMALVVVSLLLFVPVSVKAKGEQDALRTAIRAAITSDTRSAGMTEAQIDAMTAALARQAESKGISAQDVARASRAAGNGTPSSAEPAACTTFLCKVNEAFGLTGSSTLIPITLGITSAILFFVIGMLIEHHRRKIAGGGV